ncbi:MAG: Uma2 family endonuclease [Planctomycetes bacterium]|nr:Uma2 family endonuclease [Planctomycetota bacterium]
MASMPPPPVSVTPSLIPPESWPNFDDLITEDGKPVDGIFSEKQMRLLTSSLYDSWPGPGDGRTFAAMANVGLFYSPNEPPVVPDVLLSLDVQLGDQRLKRNRSYFYAVHKKMPETVFEIVSNTEGEELDSKRQLYAALRIPYYVVWDPAEFLSKQQLYCYHLHRGKYKEKDAWMPLVGLGIMVWKGAYETWDNRWLRWCDQQGKPIPTGSERAEQEKHRAAKLAEKLRAMGIDPDQP